MAPFALPLLVLLPLLTAAVVLAAPAVWARRAALGGAGLSFLVALWAASAFVHVRDLRGWFEGPGGPLEQTLARAGVDDPYAAEALRDLVVNPRSPPDTLRVLERLAGVDEARRVAQWTVPDPERQAANQAALRSAEAELAALQAALARVRDEAHALRVVYGRSGERFKLPWTRPWLPALGISWSLGLDGLSLPLLLATTLLAVVALLGAPDVRLGAASGPLRGVSASVATRGPLVAVLLLQALLTLMVASLDVAVLHVAWALLLVPVYFVVAPRGGAAAGAALRLIVVGAAGALAGLAAAGALSASAAGQGGAAATWSLLALNEAALHGEVHPDHQRLLVVVLLAATATRLPLPGLLRAQAEALGAVPAWLQGFVQWTVFLGAAFPVLRVAWPLAPVVSVSSLGPSVAALGVLAMAGGGLLALRAATAQALLSGSLLSHVGLVLLGLGALRAEAAQGAILDVLVAGLATSALAPLLAGVARRTARADLGALSGLGHVAPRLASLVAVLLALAGGVTAATLLVVWGAVQGELPPWLALLGGLAAVLVAAAHVRLALRVVEAPRAEAGAAPARVSDLSDDEALVSLPLLIAAVLVGLAVPTLALDLAAPAAEWLTHASPPAVPGGS